MQFKFGMHISDMHVCICKLTCTYLVHTQELLNDRFNVINLAWTHVCKMKNVLCQAEGTDTITNHVDAFRNS